MLLETAEGSITWDCRLPCAEARIELEAAGRLSGLGYAEQLTSSVKPWRLPFDELRWGRFLSPEHAVTWIEWGGEEPRRWVFHNGLEISDATIGPGSVVLPNEHAAIELQDGVVLREGRLLSTALRSIPAARVWLRKTLKNAHETKWLTRGTLTTSLGSSSGWAVHEVVRLR